MVLGQIGHTKVDAWIALREYLLKSGHRSTEAMTEFENQLYLVEWKLPLPRQMTCYGALQETATYLGYRLLRERHIAVGDRFSIDFSLIGRDEAAHAGFYRSLMTIELERDREGMTLDMVYVILRFKMPGDGLVPNYHDKAAGGRPGIRQRVVRGKSGDADTQSLLHELAGTAGTLGQGRAHTGLNLSCVQRLMDRRRCFLGPWCC